MSRLAISGHRNDTMFIFLGDGANEKSILLSLLMEMLGDEYSCLMPEKTLELSMDSIRYQQLSYLENKRLVGVNSNAPEDIQNIDFLKKDNVDGHKLWVGKVNTKLNLTCVYMVNSLNNIDDDILKNVTIINFKTKFVENVVNDNEILRDTYIGSTLFNTTYKHIMLHYILNYKY
jgi:phage/plasmid-associated DNA primase